MTITEKKLFKHGGSFAVDLPKAFFNGKGNKVIIKYDQEKIIIIPKSDLDNIESEPEFEIFIKSLLADSLGNPNKLKDMNQVWDEEWDELLKDVKVDDDE
jgi:virulence-associated protein VagC